MPDFESLYPGRFLKGVTLTEPKVIRVTSVAATDLEGDDGVKAKCVLTYRDADGKGEIVFCKTNAILVAAMFDERDFTKWVGRLITIHFDPNVMFGAKKVGGVRVFGSPELGKRKQFEIKMPRKKRAETFILQPTDGKGRVVAVGTASGKAAGETAGETAEPGATAGQTNDAPLPSGDDTDTSGGDAADTSGAW